jgi:hypothetical protein
VREEKGQRGRLFPWFAVRIPEGVVRCLVSLNGRSVRLLTSAPEGYRRGLTYRWPIVGRIGRRQEDSTCLPLCNMPGRIAAGPAPAPEANRQHAARGRARYNPPL